MAQGQDGLIYGAARRNGWEAFMFSYDPGTGAFKDMGRVKAEEGHIASLVHGSDGRLYGIDTELSPCLIAYDPVVNTFTAWGTVEFAATAPAGTSLSVDVLDAQGNTLLSNIASGASLSSFGPSQHPALQLRASLRGNGTSTPQLDYWSISFSSPVPLSTISGSVVGANRSPLAGVTISDGAGHTTVSGADGSYTFYDLLPDTYVLTAEMGAWVSTPTQRTVRVPPAAFGQGFVFVADAVRRPLSPQASATLSYSDTSGLVTTLDFDAHAVDVETTVFLTPTLAVADTNQTFAGHAFELAAFQGGALQSGFSPSVPVTITLHYNDDDIRTVSEEDQLTLYRWTGSDWQDAALTCTPAQPYLRDLENNVLQVPICQFSTFALFGPTHQINLPLVMRQSP